MLWRVLCGFTRKVEARGKDGEQIGARLALDSDRIRLGRARGRWSQREKALEEETYLSVLSPAKNPYVSLQIEPSLPPRAFF